MRGRLLKSALPLLVVAAGFGLGACGDGGSEDGAATTTTSREAAPPASRPSDPSEGQGSGNAGAAPKGESSEERDSPSGSKPEPEPAPKPAPSTPAPAAGAAPVPLEQAQQACEARQPDLPAEARATLDRICEAAEAGDEEALREAVADACRKLVIGSTPEGSRERAMGLESCAGSAG